ncbi:MAG: hypothetical protein KGY76_09620 [Candidatus Thermoplasmatota archaeon]|nr:hypothetical protein [Candidatus Thermoplasmatota archaeon]
MSEYKCPLCGNEFDQEGVSACRGCPLSGGCNLVRCSNCGYEFAPGVDER